MPYLGNIPASEFRSIDYQDFTGVTGSPAKRGFTLNSQVHSANDLEIFVNNVRQEPGVAYTVAGTTLTMTGDVETTDDFYVVYQGKATGTVSVPDGSVTSAKLDTNIAVAGDLTVDTDTLFVDSTNNRVGVGTVSPSTSIEISRPTPTIKLTDTNVANQYSTISGDAGSVVIKADDADSTSGVARIQFFLGGAEKARFLGSGGLAFNGDTAADNALDDYEQGTWTPQIQDTSGNVSSTSAVTAFYTKVGRLVNVTCQINNISTSGLTGAQDLRIYGLPFVANGSSSGSVMVTALTTVSSTGTITVNTYLTNNATYLALYESRRATTGLISNVNTFSTGVSDLFISHTYQTD